MNFSYPASFRLLFAFVGVLPALAADPKPRIDSDQDGGRAVYGGAAQAPLAGVVNAALETATAQYIWLLSQLSDDKRLPRSFENSQRVTVPSSDWTSGFFPGSLWHLFEATGDDRWREAARRYTALLEPEQYNRGIHDVGFMLGCSYGRGLLLTRDPAYRAILLNGAASLSTRFNPNVGCIKSWDHERWTYPVIIDNMMNLELLLWAAREGGPSRYRDIAMAHADTTLRDHFRPDGSTFHVVDYDPATGKVLQRKTHQGVADGSAWARGQAWAIYGYTMMYRETRDPRYLAQAERTAEFVMHHPRMPADKVPYWDFDAPGIPREPRDAAAAAIICSALFELSDHADRKNQARYLAFAEAQLRTLASPAYLATTGTNGGFLLKHATGNYPKHSEIDAPINYADYYFLEALLRARRRSQ